jgi:hypothetical protein
MFNADCNMLGGFTLLNSAGNPSFDLFGTISSILNRKAAGYHSPLSWGLLNPKNLSVDYNRKGSGLIWNSIQINSQSDVCSDGRTPGRKHIRSMLTHVPTAAFALLEFPIPVCPPKCNRGLQQEAEIPSGRVFRNQQSPLRILRNSQ